MRLCSVAGCGDKHFCKGMCLICFGRWRYANDPRCKSMHRKRYLAQRADTEAVAKKNAESRERYATDEAFKAKRKAQWQKNKLDIEYRARLLAVNRRRTANFPEWLVEACRSLQEGKCDICKVEMVKGKSKHSEHADHCHDTGEPRGLLCHLCNTDLGKYEKWKKDGAVYLRFDRYLENTPVMRACSAEAAE